MAHFMSDSVLSAEAAGDVVFCLLFVGILKHDTSVIELDQIAHQKEPGVVGEARSLLHVVRDDHDRGLLLQLKEQLFDFQGCDRIRSEEHTSELQSRQYLVCRLLLEKKNKI